jgi:citrate/tricarballylate utilization protein
MYTPPHEFAVNLPQAFSEVRRRTYQRYTLPGVIAGLTGASLRSVALVAALTALFFVVVVALTGDPARLFSTHQGPGSFYAVIPYVAMFLPPLLIALYGVVALASGAIQFWRETRGSLGNLVDLQAFIEAAGDAFGLRYMYGGEDDGCYYPVEQPSRWRWLLHSLVFWGFLSALAGSTIAFIYQDLFHWMPPYPILSAPVILGSIGGIAMIVGATGLIYLKRRSDPAPADKTHVAMDYVFLVVLDLASLTGMLLLVLRDTPAMGSLLVIHLAAVFALFVAAPYGKFAHLVYRYAALVQNRLEERQAEARHH